MRVLVTGATGWIGSAVVPELPGHPCAVEEGVPVREIAEAIGRQLGVPARSIAPEQAGEHFGWLAGFAALDVRASNAQTRERLGWEPERPGIVEGIERGHCSQKIRAA